MEEVIAIWNQATSEAKKYIPKISIDWEGTKVSDLAKHQVNKNQMAEFLHILSRQPEVIL